MQTIDAQPKLRACMADHRYMYILGDNSVTRTPDGYVPSVTIQSAVNKLIKFNYVKHLDAK